MLTNLETLLGTLGCLCEQILYFLIVNLEHVYGDLALDSLGRIFLHLGDTFEDLLAGSGYDTFVITITDDRITLS